MIRGAKHSPLSFALGGPLGNSDTLPDLWFFLRVFMFFVVVLGVWRGLPGLDLDYFDQAFCFWPQK